jgi:nicotinate-nucleotide adenylyltransferase
LKIGIVGGTFDPPHYAHLILAEHARDELQLDLVLFVPAGVPPHKDSTRTSIDHRLAMLELAIGDNPAFHISRVDIDRPPPHYSVDMVRLIASQYPNSQFRFIIGEDSFLDLPTWKTPLQIVERGNVKIAVMNRPGIEGELDRHLHDETLPGLAEHIIILSSRMVEISSTEIVRRLRENRSVRYLLPDSVLGYIEQHRLYLES